MFYASPIALGVGCLVLACNAFDRAPERDGQTQQSEPTFVTTPTASSAPEAISRGHCGTRYDHDGDGLTAIDTVRCSAEQATLLPSQSGDDCDDFNASRGAVVSYYRDADGDGVGDGTGQVLWACPNLMFAGLVNDGTDCNDAESGERVVIYPDRDGDGQGAAGEVVCGLSDTPGFADDGFDCDDEAPTVFRWAPGEKALDGVDTDCSGFDAPMVATEGLELAWGEPALCAGGVLAVIALEREDTWGFRLHVANVGDADVEQAELILVRATALADPVRMPLLGPVAPGRTVLSQVLRNGTWEVSFSYGADPDFALDGGTSTDSSHERSSTKPEASLSEWPTREAGSATVGHSFTPSSPGDASTGDSPSCELAKAPAEVSVERRGDPL